MASRLTPCPDPQIHTSQEGAGATRCCIPRLDPQIEAAEEGAEMSRRRRDGNSPAAPASPLEDDDLLREILLHLPPQPSSLPRASAVCKRWLGLVTDPKFTRRFRVHHRKPPLLGFFEQSYEEIVFTPALDRPDRVPPERFNLGLNGYNYSVLDCRHGLILVEDRVREEVVVCAPVTGEQRLVAIPPEFEGTDVNGAVLCAAGNQGHGCHSSPFKMVLASLRRQDNHQPIARVYSSENGEWGNLISAEAPSGILDVQAPVTLVANVLYWLFITGNILEFDLDRQNLAVTMGPPDTYNKFFHDDKQIIQAEDGGVVGYAILAPRLFLMWQRNVSCQHVAIWVPWKTIDMHNILGLSLQIGGEIRCLLGYDDDNDVIFVYASDNVYAVQLKSMHSKKLYPTNGIHSIIHPFKSFYTPGTAINGGSNGAEMLHDTKDACLV